MTIIGHGVEVNFLFVCNVEEAICRKNTESIVFVEVYHVGPL